MTFRADVLGVLEEILTTHAGGRVLAVTHGGVTKGPLHEQVTSALWYPEHRSKDADRAETR